MSLQRVVSTRGSGKIAGVVSREVVYPPTKQPLCLYIYLLYLVRVVNTPAPLGHRARRFPLREHVTRAQKQPQRHDEYHRRSA